MRIICVNTGDKYSQWYTDNLKHMIDNYSCLNYDSFEVIDEELYGGVYDKLQMFDKFRDDQNIYFDLDVVIKDDCNSFLRKDLTVLHAWWRKYNPGVHDYYPENPINSSVISWSGDYSHIHEKFSENPDKYMLIYDRGMDEYLYKEFNPNMYPDDDYYSFQKIKEETNYKVCLFNQTYEHMKTTQWCQKYLLQSQ